MNTSKKTYRVIRSVSALLFSLFGRYPVSWLVSAGTGGRRPFRLSSASSRFITTGSGNTLHIEFDGPSDAKSIVFIHGINSHSQQWFYQRLHFRKRFNCVFIDLPGHGRSPYSGDVSVATLAGDLEHVLKLLQLNKPLLYGHSMGAMILMEFCRQAERRSLVSGIILQHCTFTNPFKTCRFSSVLQLVQRPFIIPFLKSVIHFPYLVQFLSVVIYMNGLSNAFFRYIFFTGKQTPEIMRFMSRIPTECSPAAVAAGILDSIRFQVGPELQSMELPCLIIAGERDRLTLPDAGQVLHRHIQHSTFCLVREGHLSLAENPLEVNMALHSFIDALSEDPGEANSQPR